MQPLVEVFKVGMSTHRRIINSIPKRWDGIGTSKGKDRGFLFQWDKACNNIKWLDGNILSNQNDILKPVYQNWNKGFMVCKCKPE